MSFGSEREWLHCMTRAISPTPTITSPKKLAIKMIHVDALHPNASIWELRQRALHQSMARQKYLSTSLRTYGIMNHDADGIEINLQPSARANVFLADVSIGKPPIPQLLVIDTGSPLTWTRCAPCPSCTRQLRALFDPTKSATHTHISCWSAQCRSLGGKCDNQDSCTFSMGYQEGSKVDANVVAERFTITRTDGMITQFPVKTFGCVHQINMELGEENGILGLSAAEYSVVNQLGGMFSYCIGSITDPTYEYHQLILGEGAWLDGPYTPLDLYKDYYYVKLLYITVGDTRLKIDPAVFTRTGDAGGVTIDSGSTVTMLVRPAYDVLYAKVKSLVPRGLRQAEQQDLCYYGHIDEDIAAEFAHVTFHFEGGATIVLGRSSLFWQPYRSMFCMAISPTNRKSTIGVISQQHYNVGFNLINKKMYLNQIDCEYLDE